MPNWVTTMVIAKDDTKLRELLLDESGNVDFNRVVPMPEDLHITSGSYSIEVFSPYFREENQKRLDAQRPVLNMLETFYTDEISQAQFTLNVLNDNKVVTAIKKLRGWKQRRGDNGGMSADSLKEALVTFIKGFFNIKRYGHKDWYDWARENWGTKWNAGDTCVNNTRGIIEFQTAWSTPYPLLLKIAEHTDIRVIYADEDRGSNCGMFDLIKNSDGEVECIDIMGESNELACYVWDYDCPTVYDEDDWDIIDDESDERYIAFMDKYKPVFNMIDRLFSYPSLLQGNRNAVLVG